MERSFNKHKEWLETEGESGEQLVLEFISSKQLTEEQFQLLTDSVLTECTFTDVRLNEIDFYHTEMYSCKFTGVSFCGTQFIKSEINDTEFSGSLFESASLSNAEIFDSIFSNCHFTHTTFISAGIWNTVFNNCVLTNIDFDNAYIKNVILVDSKIINPLNLDKATKIIINIGTVEKPVLLSHEESVKWIQEHTIL